METLTVCPSTLAEGFDTYIFATEHPLAHELINRSFLSEQLKRYYWQSYNYRRTTLSPYHGE